MLKYEIKEVDEDFYSQHCKVLGLKIFEENTQLFSLNEALSDKEKDIRSSLRANLGKPINIYFAVLLEGKCIGWSWGFQKSGIEFYMCNSAILPEYRRSGLYTRLLNAMLEKVQEFGFQEISSRHLTTNNAVIIPKLKVGFVITQLEVSDLFGAVVHLTYHFNKTRKKVLDYRVGQIKPDSEIKRHLNLK